MQDQHGQGRVLDYMAKTALIAVYAQAGSALSAYPSGVASDKWGRKPLVYMACLGMGGIYLFMGCNKGTPENLAMLLGFFWGVCNGCFVAVDFAIAIDTLPDKNDAARYLGVWGVSAFVGTTLGPITGGLALYFLGALRQIYPAARQFARRLIGVLWLGCRSNRGRGRWGRADGRRQHAALPLLTVRLPRRHGARRHLERPGVRHRRVCGLREGCGSREEELGARLKSAAHTELER